MSEELFEKLPEMLFKSFRNQMLLGRTPAKEVSRLLAPLLLDFYRLMFQLPRNLQEDFENILRIYPDVAESFGLRIKPPLAESLLCFSRFGIKAGSGKRAGLIDIDIDIDIAAEDQQKLQGARSLFFGGGQGFFSTDRGNAVYLEFCYSEGEDWVSFEYKPPHFEIEIHLCGVYTTTLSPGEPKRNVPVNSLAAILSKCVRGVDVQIIECAV